MLQTERGEMLIASQPEAFIPGVGLLSAKTSACSQGWILMTLPGYVRKKYTTDIVIIGPTIAL